jgi:hypothetical protein
MWDVMKAAIARDSVAFILIISAILGLGPASAAQERSPPAKPSATAPAPAATAPAAKPTPPPRGYAVDGFRSAKFGMDEAAVRKAIVADLKVKAEAIRSEENQLQRTSALVVEVSALEPGPGKALVSYIFGHRSKKLSQINVLWGVSAKGVDANHGRDIAQTAAQLADYFRGFAWRDNGLVHDVVLPPNTLIVLRGEDRATGAVELVLGNVAFRRDDATGGDSATVPPQGPAFLRLSYIQNRDEPDIYKIKDGQF